MISPLLDLLISGMHCHVLASLDTLLTLGVAAAGRHTPWSRWWRLPNLVLSLPNLVLSSLKETATITEGRGINAHDAVNVSQPSSWPSYNGLVGIYDIKNLRSEGTANLALRSSLKETGHNNGRKDEGCCECQSSWPGCNGAFRA
jgi:hypothetical protein